MLILRVSDLEHQLQSIHNRAVDERNALIAFRVNTANILLRLGAEVWPLELR
jgi:hypothetical protein